VQKGFFVYFGARGFIMGSKRYVPDLLSMLSAFTVRGYDEGHVSILSSDLVIAKVYEFLNANSN
jgi:hypothetical protein